MNKDEVVNETNPGNVVVVAPIQHEPELSEADTPELEMAEPTKFVMKAMIFESSAQVHSVLTLPDDFKMPGFLLVRVADGAVCEVGMIYDRETGQFSPAPELQESEEQTLSTEEPPAKQ